VKIRLLYLTMTALAVLAATAHAAEPYNIQTLLPLTGGAAFLGQGEQVTLGIVEKVVNASGGIHGRPVHFVIHDDQTSPQLGVQLANEILEQKPVVMMGSSLVATCRAIEPLMSNGPVDYCF